MDDDIEFGGPCPKCSRETHQRECGHCQDGYSDHDCGDDCCCCADPEPNVRCDMCRGHGWQHWCPYCGWDILCKHYIGGTPADAMTPPATASHENATAK